MDNNKVIINILNNMKTFDILIKINKFNQLTPKTASRKDLLECLHEAVPVHLITHRKLDIPEFFRVRKNDDRIPFNTHDDFWYPPANKANIGRLNKKNESMLYLSLDPATPFHEVRIQPGEYFTLMMYGYKSDKKLFALLIEGLSMEKQKTLRELGLTETGLVNYNTINNLIRSEMIKDVGKGTEYLYDITNLIKNLFDKDNSEQAFLYSSVNNYQHKNCAIRPNAADSILECTGCIFGKLLSYSDNGETVSIKPLKRTMQKIEKDRIIEYESFCGNGIIDLKMFNK